MEETYSIIEGLDIDGANLNYVTPYPDAKLYEQCVRDGLLTEFTPGAAWNVSSLHHGNDHIFVKPYTLSLDDLRLFQSRCKAWIQEKVLRASACGRQLEVSRNL